MNKDILLEKLYSDESNLTSEEIVYLSNLITRDQGPDILPYYHTEQDIPKAVGFDSKKHYMEFVEKENHFLEQLSLKTQTASEVVEIVESRVRGNTLALRAILLGISSKTR